MAMTSLMPPWPARVFGDHVDLPALPLREAGVHAEHLGREQRGLVAAGAGADLQQDVLLVVGVLGDEEAAGSPRQARRAAPPARAAPRAPSRAARGRPRTRIISWTLVISASSALVGAIALDDRARCPWTPGPGAGRRTGPARCPGRTSASRPRRSRASTSFSFWKVMESMVQIENSKPLPDSLARSERETRGRRQRPAQTSLAPGVRRSGDEGRLGLGGGRLLAVLAREPLDAAGGVDQLLLAREERVAAGADLEAQLLALGGAWSVQVAPQAQWTLTAL